MGGAGNDRLRGHEGNDTLLGESGEDILKGGAGNDILNGGAGIDTAAYSTSAVRVFVDLRNGIYREGDAQGDTLISIENLRGSAYGDKLKGDDDDNVIWGGDGNDFLTGRLGDDTLWGGVGNDVLIGGAGADTIIGNAGIDAADYSTSSAGVYAHLKLGVGWWGDAQGDTYADIENLMGSAFNDRLRGNSGDNRLEGSTGNDRLEGASGNDTLLGGTGNDILYGNSGNDLFVFADGAGDDIIMDFTAGAGTDDVIDVSDFTFASYNAFILNASDDGTDTTFALDADDSVSLLGVQLADLHQDDFLFV